MPSTPLSRNPRHFLGSRGILSLLLCVLLCVTVLMSSCQETPSELPPTSVASVSSEASVATPSSSAASSIATLPSSLPNASSDASFPSPLPSKPSNTTLPSTPTELQDPPPRTDAPSDDVTKPPPQIPEPTLDVPPPLLGDTAALSADPFFDDAFFIGDSITTGLDMLVDFDERPRLARIGLTLQSADTEIRDYVGLHPSYVFVLLGTNDLNYYNMNEELYAERYWVLIQTLRELFPEATIFPQTILPVADFYDGSESITNERIASFNAALAALCIKHNLNLVDIAAAWRLPDLSLHPDVTSDGLHINYQYYGSWLQLLKSAVLIED